jgi:hypothetical protein
MVKAQLTLTFIFIFSFLSFPGPARPISLFFLLLFSPFLSLSFLAAPCRLFLLPSSARASLFFFSFWPPSLCGRIFFLSSHPTMQQVLLFSSFSGAARARETWWRSWWSMGTGTG